MAHDTWDMIEEDGHFYCQSHNFPECIGEGDSAEEAWNSMDRQIVYYADNNKKAFVKRINARVTKGMACECGKKLDGKPLVIQKGRLG